MKRATASFEWEHGSVILEVEFPKGTVLMPAAVNEVRATFDRVLRLALDLEHIMEAPGA